MTLLFPEVKTIDNWKAVSKKLLVDLKTGLNGFDASFSKVPKKYVEQEKIDMTFDSPDAKQQQPAPEGDPEVQLILKEL